MKNEHLVPQIILDLGSKINDKNIRNNEKNNYIIRLEAIRDFCLEILASKNISTLVKKQ